MDEPPGCQGDLRRSAIKINLLRIFPGKHAVATRRLRAATHFIAAALRLKVAEVHELGQVLNCPAQHLSFVTISGHI